METVNETTPSTEPASPVRGTHRFRLVWPALLATGITLGGCILCSIYEKSDARLVGLGMLTFFGFKSDEIQRTISIGDPGIL